MQIGEKWFTLDEDDADEQGKFHVHFLPASADAVSIVLLASENDDDGRSEWLWIRLPNGDLILGVLPQGGTYITTEPDNNPYSRKENGNA